MRQIFVNFALWVADVGYIGECKELTPPVLEAKTLDYMAGGMGGALKVPMGQIEAMEAQFTLISYNLDALRNMGFVWGQEIALDARGAVSAEDGTTKSVRVSMRGHLTKGESDAWKAGEEVGLQCTMQCTYYLLEANGETIAEADPENGVLIVNGVDQTAAQRTAMGI